MIYKVVILIKSLSALKLKDHRRLMWLCFEFAFIHKNGVNFQVFLECVKPAFLTTG